MKSEKEIKEEIEKVGWSENTIEATLNWVLSGEPRYSVAELEKLTIAYIDEAIEKKYFGFADFFIWIQDAKKIKQILESSGD